MKLSHVEWCRQLFATLGQNGVWGIPRSGLTFKKIGNDLVLTDRMPWSPVMGRTDVEWRAYQDEDFRETKEHFEAAGINVRDGTDPIVYH